MYVLRPIREDDEIRFIQLALHTPSALTSLPKDTLLIQNKIENALLSFQSNTKATDEGQYLFVLEQVETNEIVGVSALYTNVGFNSPIYYYRIIDEERGEVPESLSRYIIPQKLLKIVPAGEGSTEIGTLFLKHEHRKEGLGPLLSLSRFLFVASFPHLFADTIHANMRGVFDENGIPHFWEHFGRHFANIDYNTVIDTIQHNRSLALSLFPSHPIYLSLLPKDAQEVIGKTHANTAPALKMLQNEGFEWNNEIDPFDGGPLIYCETKKVRTITHSKVSRIQKIIPLQKNGTRCLIATHNISFCTCYGEVEILEDNEVIISEEVAKALHLKTGQYIRFLPLKSGESPHA